MLGGPASPMFYALLSTRGSMSNDSDERHMMDHKHAVPAMRAQILALFPGSKLFESLGNIFEIS